MMDIDDSFLFIEDDNLLQKVELISIIHVNEDKYGPEKYT